MAKSPAAVGSTGKFGDLKRRLLFLIGALIVYRLGTHLPLPGINQEALVAFFNESGKGGFFGMFDLFSGGALQRMSIFTLGIMPYISASIIMQLLAVAVPQLEALKKEGEAGRRKITQYTRYGTVVLALFQALLAAIGLESQTGGNVALVPEPGFVFRFVAVTSLVTGTMFLMWLGEQITERGVGNGISIIIFSGIVAGLPGAIGNLSDMVANQGMHSLKALFICAIVVLVSAFVVFVERGQRKILVNYAKRQVGNRVYGGQSSHLPLKLNMSGVIPPIFASSILMFIGMIGPWTSKSEKLGWLGGFFSNYLGPEQPLYMITYSALIIFFCFFYTALVFNPRDTADNLKKSGAFVPGIRPGEQTARYVDRVLMRLTLAGAAYITLVCLLPEFLRLQMKVSFYFGGTSLLIVVVVALDFKDQVQNYVLSHQYESLLKKANFKGAGLPIL